MRQRAVDHTPIIVRDLDEAYRRYTLMGFDPMPIGYHTGRATANHILLFEHGYTELIGLVDPSQRDPVIDDMLRAREGISLISLSSDDAAADRAMMAGHGFDVGEVLLLERPVDIAGFRGDARFRLVLVETPEHPLVQLFFTEHLTPQVIRFPQYLSHPNGAQGIDSITIVADDPVPLTALFESAVGTPPVEQSDGQLRFTARETTIEIIAPQCVDERFPDCVPETRRPYILGQCLRVDDVRRTAACLSDGGIPFSREQDGTLTVAPEQACGVLLRFSSNFGSGSQPHIAPVA